MNEQNRHFIVIDDSKLDCFIAQKIIKNTGIAETVESFLQASDALEFIKQRPAEELETIVLVDVPMPVMDGFEFVEAFDKLPQTITSRYTIFLISSSISEKDFARVHGLKSVKSFLSKPLTSHNLVELLSKMG